MKRNRPWSQKEIDEICTESGANRDDVKSLMRESPYATRTQIVRKAKRLMRKADREWEEEMDRLERVRRFLLWWVPR